MEDIYNSPWWTTLTSQQTWIRQLSLLSSDTIDTVSHWLKNVGQVSSAESTHLRSAPPIESIDTLLRTNHRPSLAQKQTLNSRIENATSDLFDLDVKSIRLQLEINRLTLDLQVVHVQREERMREIDLCRSLLAPVRLLPQELLVTIFGYDTLEKYSKPEFTAPSPLCLSHVSSAWRTAVISSPPLWNCLALDVDRCEPKVVTTWFNRAEARPLSLSLTFQSSAFGPFLPPTKLSHSIRLFSHQLSVLVLNIRSLRDLKEFLSLPGGNVPHLKSVRLKVNSDSVPNMPITFMDQAPSLRSVSLHGLHSVAGDVAAIKLPWYRLTHLDIRNVSPNQPCLTAEGFERIFCLCARLSTASFTVGLPERDNGSTLTSDEVATFSHLTSLFINFVGSDAYRLVERTMNKAILPALEILVLGNAQLENRIPLRFIIPSFSTGTQPLLLRCLIISGMTTRIPEVLDLISRCVLLEQLALEVCGESSLELLEAIQLQHSHGTLSFLNLESFVISAEHSETALPSRFSEAFINLAVHCADNPMRLRPFRFIALYIYDYEDIETMSDPCKELFSNIREHLDNRPLRINDGPPMSLGETLVVTTEFVPSHFSIFRSNPWIREALDGLLE